MESQTKTCQNCKQNFFVEPDDFNFYEKMKVPAPVLCFDCQLQQRLAFRNERGLHKRKCDAPGHDEQILTFYSPSSKAAVYDRDFWWTDKWDPMIYGKEYSFSKPFFEQFLNLYRQVPVPSLMNFNTVNSEYCNYTTDNKNCYLVFGGDFNEDCFYSGFNFYSKNSSDMYFTDKCELCYEVVDTNNCFNVKWSKYAVGCTDSAFLYDCVGCSNCVGCVGLRNQNYHILNKAYTKEEYQKKLKELNLDSALGISELRKEFEKLELSLPHKFARILKSAESTGENLFEVRDVINSYDVHGPAEHIKDTFLAGWNFKDARYCDHAGHHSELVYNSFAVFSDCSNIKLSFWISSSHDIEYSFNCRNCHDLFACAGLTNKQYCIFNKQYTKEEFEELVPKIKKHMDDMPYTDSQGRVYKFGDFLPMEFSPHAYNESIAQEYFPLKKEEILAKGLFYEEQGQRSHAPTIKSKDIPETIATTPDTIVNEIIECEHKQGCDENCTGAFKITQAEFLLYKQLNVPIPHLCPNCRHYQRLRKRNPLKLWHRKCMKPGCTNEFETPYFPERKEIIYCEKCYQQEVA
jgi:hypothetical protein